MVDDAKFRKIYGRPRSAFACKRWDKRERAVLAGLFSRLLHEPHGRVETEEESRMLQALAVSLDRPPPKYACPHCWMLRALDGIE